MMEGKRPFISVVMPVYNVEKHLKKAIDSVLNQTYKDCEIILVDDCSPDRCAEICDKYAEQYENIQVIHHNKNQGLSMARNTGMEVAAGEYIWFMDSDDYVENDLFEKVYHSVENNPAEVIVFGLTEDYYNAQGQIGNSQIIPTKEKTFHQQELRQYVISLEQQTLYGYAWNKIYNLDYLRKLELKFEKITLIEDILFNVQFFMDIHSMNIIDFTGYHYNKRMDNSLTSKFVPEYYKLHRKRIELIYKQYQYWEMCTDEVKAILGALYTRYIFSAIQRNCDTRAEMNHKKRRQWTKHMMQEKMVKELISHARSDGKLLNIMIKVLQKRQITLALFIGRTIYICKNQLPILFSALKQKR
mgnify:CR=1 FL=1